MDLNLCWSEENDPDTEAKKIFKIAEEENNGINKTKNKNNINNNHNQDSKYIPVILSKFEQDAFNKAKERQADRMKNGVDQHAVGRVFKGPGFVAKPTEILFKDFEIGKKYTKNVTFTNISYAFNTFKLLDLTDSYVDFFEITYEKLGRMSAGVSVNIEIVFSPKMNEDIHTGMICLHIQIPPSTLSLSPSYFSLFFPTLLLLILLLPSLFLFLSYFSYFFSH